MGKKRGSFPEPVNAEGYLPAGTCFERITYHLNTKTMGKQREEESFDRLAEGDGSTVSPNQAQIELDETGDQSSKQELVEKETRKVKENEKYVGG